MEGYSAKEILLSTKDKLGELDRKLKRLREMTSTEWVKKCKKIHNLNAPEDRPRGLSLFFIKV